MVKKRRRSRLSASIQSELIGHFVAAASARSAAEICGVNRNTAILFFHKLRELLADNLAAEAPDLIGEIEVDESYFGGVRKGKRGRGAAGKIPVFEAGRQSLRRHHPKCPHGNIIESGQHCLTDSFDVHVSDFHHVRMLFVNGIENFWNQAKRHLRRYNGIPKHFHLYLKECNGASNRPTANLLKVSAMGKYVITSSLAVSAPNFIQSLVILCEY